MNQQVKIHDLKEITQHNKSIDPVDVLMSKIGYPGYSQNFFLTNPGYTYIKSYILSNVRESKELRELQLVIPAPDIFQHNELCFVAPRGSGKTTAIATLINLCPESKHLYLSNHNLRVMMHQNIQPKIDCFPCHDIKSFPISWKGDYIWVDDFSDWKISDLQELYRYANHVTMLGTPMEPLKIEY